jgi:sulfatase-like protein
VSVRTALSPRRSAHARRAALALVLALLAGCRSRSEPSEEVAALAPGSEQPAPAPPADTLRPFDDLALCRVDHDGLLIDLGNRASDAHRSFQLGPFKDRPSLGWADESHTRFFSRQVDYDFWLREPLPAGALLRVRARAGASRRLAVALDQQRLGTLELGPNAFQVKLLPPHRLPLERGRHVISLRWLGPAAPEEVPFGMVEWLHVSQPGQVQNDYAPPQPRSLWSDVVLGGKPRRAVVLEAPARLSCPLELPRGAELELSLGYWGDGSGVAQILSEREGGPPHVLAERRVQGADGWQDVTLKLDAAASELTYLELRAHANSAAGRIAFAEPRVTLKRPPPERTPSARLAVLVILSGVGRELLPPQNRALRGMNRLAAQAVRFEQYRVPTTRVGGVLGSLLTGLPPAAHGVQGPSSRLPRSVPTLADAVAGKSGQSALFTGVPHSFEPFGFARGFNHFEAFSPVSDVPASAPLERAGEWLKKELGAEREGRRLLVVHARGAHPPWDLSRSEVMTLEPEDYHGLLDARRGGLILSEIRARSRLARRRLTAADWTRLRAMQAAALDKDDKALDDLMRLIERAGEWDHTLFIVVGDVGSGEPPEAPFGQARPLGEAILSVPLFVKFPGPVSDGRQATAPVTSVDVALAIAQALDLPAPDAATGQDLFELASGREPLEAAPLLATLDGSYSARDRRWVLTGQSGGQPILCEHHVDPSCSTDLLAQSPLAAETLWRRTFREYRRELELAPRLAPEAADIDRDTAAALEVYGD